MFTKRILATLMLAGISFYGCAADDDGILRVNFSGTVLDPPDCVINNNQVINLAFGNVPVKQADGRTIVKTVDYNMVCKGAAANAQLAMQLSGAPGFANDVLATDLDGLGIRFYQDGVPVQLKQWFALPAVANSMVLTASPIQDPNKQTSGGSFTASATLLVAFQ